MNRRSHLALLVLVSLPLVAAGCGVAQHASSDPASTPAATTVVHAAATPAASTATRATTTAARRPIGGVVRGVVNEVTDPVGQTVSFLTDPSVTPTSGGLLYLPVAVALVLPGLETRVEAGRWALDFHSGSLLLPKPIGVSQASDGTMRVEFGPDGTVFGTPVDVSIRYDGTTADPDSPDYKPGTQPAFYWWDPASEAWVEQPCTIDPAKKVLHAKLAHFSTYGVGGKAGW